jgi:hypothetical protein
VSLNTGYDADEDGYDKNSLTGWKVVEAKRNIMKIKLEFKNPIYLSTASRPCVIQVCFGDGSFFKDAGFGV